MRQGGQRDPSEPARLDVDHDYASHCHRQRLAAAHHHRSAPPTKAEALVMFYAAAPHATRCSCRQPVAIRHPLRRDARLHLLSASLLERDCSAGWSHQL
eukprot:1549181-Pleurochrysis_carterae.AAC.1